MRKVNGIEIRQRMSDGYMDALAICDACDKDFAEYIRVRFTQRLVRELSRSTGINENGLIQKNEGVDEIWVHPQIAINLSQWASPKLAVKVPMWIIEWYIKKEKVTPKEVTVKAESTSGIKFEDIDHDFAEMISKAVNYNPDK